MPTCPRCALVALVLAVAAFTGCDSSNPGRDLNIVDGSYAVTSITFDPDGTAIDPVDVAAGLNLQVTRLDVFGGDANAILVTRFANENLSYRTDLAVEAANGRATFRGLTDDDTAELARILLPNQFSLNYTETGSRLTGTYTRTVNLQAFDPVAYSGATAIPGTLSVTLTKL